MAEADAKALVKYESSKPSVATIDDNGNLEILGLGATDIKAYIDDTDYQSAEAIYKLVVIDPNAVTATDRLNLEAFGFTQNTYAALTYTSPKTGILYSACGMKTPMQAIVAAFPSTPAWPAAKAHILVLQ